MKRLFAIVSIVLFSACSSGGGKKVVIMASGKLQVNGNTITLAPGTQHNETTFIPDGDSLTVISPSGNLGYSVKEEGLYILNLKKDTLVGSYQQTGTDNSRQVLTQENLRFRIDSLYQLMQAYNVTEAGRNYNLPPFTIAKITKNTNAQIIGPYVKIPGSFDPSKEHEVYKFYTNKEAMDIILKLVKMIR